MTQRFQGDGDDVRNWPVPDPLAPHAEALAWAADEAGIAEPTSRLMGKLGVLFHAKARHGRAERFSRRALAIDEASLGSEHPTVATRLNNLALLLQATNRLAEAAPLMRRHLVIFLAFQRNTGHPHPHRDAAIRNYTNLLSAMGRDQATIADAIAGAHREAGLA